MTNKGFWKTVNEGIHDMCYIWWMEMKNTVKDEGVLIFFILVPIVYPLLYSWIYNNEVVHDVPVTVIDMSHSSSSREYIRRLNSTPDVNVAFYCNNLSEAKELIGKQVVHGAIYIPEQFDTDIHRGTQTHISVYCDMSLMLTYKAIYQSSLAVATSMGTQIQIPKSGSTTQRDEEVATSPLKIEEVPVFNATGGYGNAILPAVLILILQQTLLLGIGLSAGTARENNRYRDLVPVSRHYNGLFRIVLGKSLCYLMIYAVMATWLTLAVPYLFGFTSMVHATDLFGLLTPFLLACIFFGMMLSCLVRYRENVMLLVVFTSVPFLFMTGVSWPQSNIPGIWQGVSWLIPSTFGVRGFLRISSMGGTLQDIRSEYIILWIQALVYFFITCGVYRFQLIRTRRHAAEQFEMMRQKVSIALSKFEEEQPLSDIK